MDPTLPMIGIDFDEIQPLGRQEVDVEPFAEVPDDGAGLRRAVEPLPMLLCGAPTEREKDEQEPVHDRNEADKAKGLASKHFQAASSSMIRRGGLFQDFAERRRLSSNRSLSVSE